MVTERLITTDLREGRLRSLLSFRLIPQLPSLVHQVPSWVWNWPLVQATRQPCFCSKVFLALYEAGKMGGWEEGRIWTQAPQPCSVPTWWQGCHSSSPRLPLAFQQATGSYTTGLLSKLSKQRSRPLGVPSTNIWPSNPWSWTNPFSVQTMRRSNILYLVVSLNFHPRFLPQFWIFCLFIFLRQSLM